MYLDMETVLFRPRLIRLISPHIFMGDWKQNIEILVLFFFLHFYLSQLSLPKKIEILIHFFFIIVNVKDGIQSYSRPGGVGGGLDMRWNDAVPLYARFNVYHFSWKYGSIDQ